jgi:hypothetical protein
LLMFYRGKSCLGKTYLAALTTKESQLGFAWKTERSASDSKPAPDPRSDHGVMRGMSAIQVWTCGLRVYVANLGLERTGTAMKEMVRIGIVEDGMKGGRINL